MNLETITEPPENQLTHEQREHKKKRLISSIKIRPGHKIYELEIATGDVREAVFEQVNADIKGRVHKKLIQKVGHAYCAALNPKNAVKRFRKQLNLK